MSDRIVILGAGIAGISACERILAEAPGTEITLISGERDLPYVRPLLSKLALSTFRRNSLALHTADWYAESSVRLLTGTAVDRLLTERKTVLLENGTAVPYDKCIYALGARSFIPPIPGADLPGTAGVRTIDDLQKVRRLLAAAEHAVVIGGGVIGLEFAWEIKKAGCDVTLLEAQPHLMERVLDTQSAQVLEECCAACGVPVHTGVQIARIAGAGRVQAVELADGRVFPADLVLIACGVLANTAAARRSGFSCSHGVLVDGNLRTSAPDVFAAGDCIQTDTVNPGLWNYAKESGCIAGFNAVHPADQALCFTPAQEPVLLSAMGTHLFAVGSLHEKGLHEECRTWQKDAPGPLFRVNPHAGGLCYEKRFYRGGVLCGAVLIGDLTAMEDIRQELERAQHACGAPEVTKA